MSGKAGRGANGRFTRSIEQAEMDAGAARLRSRGWSYGRIAAELGYSDDAAAYRAVQRVLVETVAEPAAELRQIELARLDVLYEAALGVLEREHLAIANGKVVYDFGSSGDGEGKQVLDDAPVLQAIDRCLRIQERRAKLLGLDAPAKLEVVTLDAVDAAIRDLEAELARRAATGPAPLPPGAPAAQS
jgi:hypothetical protein